MRKSWVGVEILCEGQGVDELAAEVAEAFGVGVEVANRCVRFYLEGDEFLEEWELKLRRLLLEEAKTCSRDQALSYKSFMLLDEGWADSWKEHFKPLRIGKHYLIAPTWEEFQPEGGDKVIVMDPGRAFGTGQHETTRLCLEWMESWADERDLSESALLDVGTGSGVLAIAGALLGFVKVLGIDNDPEALEVALKNVDLNGLSGRIVLEEGTVSRVSDRFDVIVANIQALPLIGMAEEITGRLKRTGTLVLSGILLEQQRDVRAAYEEYGLDLAGNASAGEWALLVFSKGRKGD